MGDELYKTPGQLILALLQERGWSQRILAVVLRVDETGLNKIITDKRPVTADLALSLEEVFGVPANRFLELQQSYDLAKARIVARPDPSRSARAHIFTGLPLPEMNKRGWINAPDPRDIERVQSELARFFGVDSIEQIEILPHAAKKTQVFSPPSPVQLAWLYRVNQVARSMLVRPFTEESIPQALARLKRLLRSAEEIRHVPRILDECGIRFVIVESLVSAKIDGVSFWINESSPVIGMTLRHDRIDNFWFVLRHELEHLAKLHGNGVIMLDTELEGERAGVADGIAEEERVANEAATTFTIPRSSLKNFIDRKAPFFYDRDILGFANTLNIHPGIVAGQIQHATGRYDRFREHLVKIRAIIAPNAMLDGWGNIAPVEE